jgi:large subunit ribosomal protein L29
MKMKARDIRPLSVQELLEKVSSLEEELFNLRFQAKMGQLSNPLRLRIVRKDVARVKTLINEKRVQKPAAPAAPAPKAEVKPREEAKPAEKAKPSEKKPKAKAKPKVKAKKKKASSK